MNFVFLFFLGLNIVADVSDNKEPDVNQNATETLFCKGEINSTFLKGQYSIEYKIPPFMGELLEKVYNVIQNESNARIAIIKNESNAKIAIIKEEMNAQRAMQKYSIVGLFVFIIFLFCGLITFSIIQKNKNTV